MAALGFETVLCGRAGIPAHGLNVIRCLSTDLFALPEWISRLKRGAVILMDDGGREGERETVARWAKRFPGMTVEFQGTEKGAYVLGLRRPLAGDGPAAAAS